MAEELPSKVLTRRNWLERIAHLFSSEPENREELMEMLADAFEHKLIDADAHTMIQGVLNITELHARDIMVPRSQMTVVDIDAEPDEFIPMIIQSGHSRFPVIGENKDEVVGILLAKDLLNLAFLTDHKPPPALQDMIRTANFVPESKRLDVLLKEFRQSRHHMAIVIDEFGGVAGLVTIEDVLEEIVGDITDEHDISEDACIKKLEDKQYLLKALTPIDEFNAYFKANLSDEEFDTIGGLVTQSLGHMPKIGESVTIDNFEFRVTHADKRRIRTLELTLLKENNV